MSFLRRVDEPVLDDMVAQVRREGSSSNCGRTSFKFVPVQAALVDAILTKCHHYLIAKAQQSAPFVIYILNWLGLDNENKGHDMQMEWIWSEQAPAKAEIIERKRECHQLELSHVNFTQLQTILHHAA
jgi:hypothetical protein